MPSQNSVLQMTVYAISAVFDETGGRGRRGDMKQFSTISLQQALSTAMEIVHTGDFSPTGRRTVITSYSIHYTKLYDLAGEWAAPRFSRKNLILKQQDAPGADVFVAPWVKNPQCGQSP